MRMFSIKSYLICQSNLLMTYKNLSQAERYQIHALMKTGHDQTQIAKLLDRHKSTISQELSRNTCSCDYRFKQASEITDDLAHINRNASILTPVVIGQANALLGAQWSPENIHLLCPAAMKLFSCNFRRTKRIVGNIVRIKN